MSRCGARLFGAAVALALAVPACSDDAERGADEPATSVSTTAPSEPAPCIDLPDIDGTTPAPVCSLGFGIAIPEGWNATRLDEQSLERLSNADLARPSFLDAAITVAASGSVFYAAGVDDEGRVSDLKVDVEDDVGTSPEDVRAAARAVAEGGDVEDATVVEDGEHGLVRVDYRLTLPDAETGEELAVHGSRLFVPDGDRRWSLIVTSEDPATLADLVEVFSRSLTFD